LRHLPDADLCHAATPAGSGPLARSFLVGQHRPTTPQQLSARPKKGGAIADQPAPSPEATPSSAISAGEFGAAFKGFLERTVAAAPEDEPVFAARLREHFGTDPAVLPIVAEHFEPSEHPNLQAALDAWLQQPARSSEAIGVTSEYKYKRFNGLGLGDVLASGRTGLVGRSGPAVGPVECINVPLDGDRVMTCVQFGLLLVRDGELAPDRDQARAFLATIRAGMRERNVYRGHAVSLTMDRFMSLKVNFHALPEIAREDIVLADGVLERVERHTIGFATHRDRLLAAGRHLRRGLLLHGQPGTGKTLTAMYLAGRMRDRTVVLLTGREVGLIPQACAMARLLQPSMVILEDVDLIAEERDRQQPGCTPLLFELLNEMDGLGDDADVIFLLTSNRPDLLEPALAARLGRVDLAVEVPLPDAGCRRRLVELYGHGLTMRLDSAGLDRLVQRIEGVSPAFIRELLRKAALLAVLPTQAAAGQDGIVVESQHLDLAMHELVLDGGELTRHLLGAAG
jgi:ATPase family associated with various cellular activities (AAA)